jgi:leucyl-tRNA synthetase
MSYNPHKIEKKWQKAWEKAGLFKAKKNNRKKKFYGLIEFPYPSGEGLHIGHPRSFTALDIICRKKRMEGYNVLYPIGFDSFGLPTENYAIKKNTKPQKVTKDNIEIFTKQLKSLGLSFDWSRSFSTSDPAYYKWTQWIFLQLFKHGLAYKEKKEINWCPSCKIGLANEEVVNGRCERCGAEVVKKEKEQWILKITQYADRLIDDLKKVNYLDQIKEQQINWIGRSEGASIQFQVKTDDHKKAQLQVFTTRPDTIFGATFMIIAPEHKLLKNLKNSILNFKEVEKYIKEISKKNIQEKQAKTGIILKGIKAVNPANQKEIPIFVSDYVSIDYGTGAIMAVPAHDTRDFEFALKYHLPIIQVVKSTQQDIEKELKEAYEEKGININSGFLNDLLTDKAIEKAIQWLEKKKLGKKEIHYHLRDWIFSRQRYWGEPIPLVFCKNCAKKAKEAKKNLSKGEILNPGWVPISEKDLPVKLPDINDFKPTQAGDSPLAKAKNWVKTTCPRCGGVAYRETDVMPNWAGSNWYYLRYCDPSNDKKLADSDDLKYWMPVDWYNGGMEHTTLHLLYSRFIYKFLYDIGAVPRECGPEPYQKRTAHGMILGENSVKMSKSKGNVINPDEYIEEYGADTIRLYEMFMGPFDQAIPWDSQGVIGMERFLKRVWDLQAKVEKDYQDNKESLKILHQTIKKVTEDVETMKFNTTIAQMMTCLNILEKQIRISQKTFKTFLILLSPFAPHICEEIYLFFQNKKNFISEEKWPDYNKELIQEETFNLVVQINGKVRDSFEVSKGITEKEAQEKAFKRSRVVGWTHGKKIKKVIFVKDKLINLVIE